MVSYSIGETIYSGFGGQADFMRGAALSKGGLPITALPATAMEGKVSRIVPTLDPGAGVVITRADAHAVVTENGGSPCGSCRQVLAEFGLHLRVLIAQPGKLVAVQTIAELLPRAFGPRDLSQAT